MDFVIDLKNGHHIVLQGDAPSGSISSSLYDADASSELNAAFDAIESLVLAQYCAGIDVSTDAYAGALITTINACIDHYGE